MAGIGLIDGDARLLRPTKLLRLAFVRDHGWVAAHYGHA